MIAENRKSYVKPEVILVQLTPADAVLSACKDGNSIASPIPCAGTCTSSQAGS